MYLHRKIRMFKVLQHNIGRFFQNRGNLRAFGLVQLTAGPETEPFGPGRRQFGQQRRSQLVNGVGRGTVIKMQIFFGAAVFAKTFAADVFPLRKSIFVTFAPMLSPAVFLFGRFLIASDQFFKSVFRHGYSPRSFLRPVSGLASFSSSFMPVYEVLTKLS